MKEGNTKKWVQCVPWRNRSLDKIILELVRLLEQQQSHHQLLPHFVAHLKGIVYNLWLFTHLKTRVKLKDWMRVNERQKIVQGECMIECFNIGKNCIPYKSIQDSLK
jgi:hypothetical protein